MSVQRDCDGACYCIVYANGSTVKSDPWGRKAEEGDQFTLTIDLSKRLVTVKMKGSFRSVSYKYTHMSTPVRAGIHMYRCVPHSCFYCI